VFAVSGGIYDPASVGCHHLIKNHQAHLLTSASDILENMNWNLEVAAPTINAPSILSRLLVLTEIEKGTLRTMEKIQHAVALTELSTKTQIPLNTLATVLLGLEMKKAVRMLPGEKVRLAA
jgi:DNA processing protein